MSGLVYLRDSRSLQEVPAAVELLRRAGLDPQTDIPADRRGDVVAVITGLGQFGVIEAADFPSLRTVARFGAGYDNVDVAGLSTRGIRVSYTPDISTREVAEFAAGMIILTLRGVARDIHQLASEEGTWRVIGRGTSLSDATVGMVGAGNIGRSTAQLIAPLAAKVLIWNRSPRSIHLDGIPAARYSVITDLHEMALQCDVISVHLALTPETRGIIGAEFFSRLARAGRSIALVNTARGNVVDEQALLDALETGTVRCAAIDVWSLEGARSDSNPVRALRRHPAVLATSHIGALTTGVLNRCALQCARNIIAGVTGTDDGYFAAASTIRG